MKFKFVGATICLKRGVFVKRAEVNMLSGSIFRGLISMTIPIMIMNVLQSLFSIIDMTVLGVMVNDDAVGAVGASSTLISLTTGLLIGIATGSTVVVAKHLGRHEEIDTDKAVGTSILFSVISGVALMVLGLVFAKTFLVWTNCPDSLLADATLYFRIYFGAVPFIMLYNFSASILRADGDTRRPMVYLTVAGILKIVLNIVFIQYFNMTVEGVGYATIISNAVAAALTFSVLVRGKDHVHFKLKFFRFYSHELKEILFVGIPTGLQSALYSLANTVITATVNGFGAAATKGISIANQFDGVLYQISVAPSFATVSFVSQNIGVGNIKRAKECVYKSVIITVLFGATIGSLSAIFSGQLSSIMSADPEVIAFSCQKMIIISSTYFICGIKEVMDSAMRGIGRPIIPTVSTLVYMCAFRFVWVYLIFPLCPNLTFLYLVWPIGWILSIATTLIFYFPTIKKLTNKYTQKELQYET